MKRTLIAIKFDSTTGRMTVELTALAKREPIIAEKIGPVAEMLRRFIEVPSAKVASNSRRPHGA